MPTNLVYEDAAEGQASDEVDVTEAVLEMLERDNGAFSRRRVGWMTGLICAGCSVRVVFKDVAVCRSVVFAAFVVGRGEPDVAVVSGESSGPRCRVKWVGRLIAWGVCRILRCRYRRKCFNSR